MKLKAIFLSLIFFVTTTLSALHELEHIKHNHDKDSSCVIFHINDKLSAVDIYTSSTEVKIVFDEKTASSSQVSNTHKKEKSNLNNAPPFHS